MILRSHAWALIYRLGAAGATLIVALAVGEPCRTARASESVLWTSADRIVAGDAFLALGYPRGIALWDWTVSEPSPAARFPEPGLGTLAAAGQRLYWSRADSTVTVAVIRDAAFDSIRSWHVDGNVSALSASGRFVTAVLDWARLAGWEAEGQAPILPAWLPPGGRALATTAVRDSTAFAGGGGWLWLLRLGAGGIEVLDSLVTGTFVQDAAWAGDTLLLAFGPSGLKMIPTVADHFGDSAYDFSDGGTYNELAVWDDGWAGLDFLGRVRIFARGGAGVPISSVESSGSLWAAAGRGSDLAILTLEYGVSILDAFTPAAPFWSLQVRLPGTARAFEYSAAGMLVQCDFSGVYALGPDSARPIMANPYNALDLDSDSGLVAATGLLSGAALFPLQTDSLALPVSSIPIGGYAAAAELSGRQLYAVSSAACNLGFNVYDVTVPSAPVPVTGWSTCAPVRDLERVPGGLAVALGDSGIWIYATPITDSTAPVAESAQKRAWQQLAWRDGYLYSRSTSGVVARWQWDGAAVTLVDSSTFAQVSWIDASGEYLATAVSSAHVDVWRWPVGGPPALRASLATDYAPIRVAIVADTLWYVDRNAVLRAVLDPATGIDDPGSPVPRAFAFDPPYPNPFNGRVELPLHLAPGDWSVAIYNILGRQVAGWKGRLGAGSDRALVWDARGPDGTSLGAGVYLISADNAGRRITRKVTFLK
jgi:hypothetical protein